jgi:hypothetical protein
MAEPIAEMRTHLSALLAARSNGARRMTYTANGVERTVEYRTDSELRTAIADLENRIAQGEGRSARVHIITSHKGWNRTAKGV